MEEDVFVRACIWRVFIKSDMHSTSDEVCVFVLYVCTQTRTHTYTHMHVALKFKSSFNGVYARWNTLGETRYSAYILSGK